MSDVARYYTRGVRFPRLIGKTHDGTRIPGGPYTMAQGVGGLTVFLAGEATRSVWGGHGLFGDYSLLLAVVAVTVVVLRFLRTSGRDPVTATFAVLGVYQQPRHGRLDGRPVRLKRPHLARGRITVMDLRPRAYDAPEPVRAPAPAIDAVRAIEPARAITPGPDAAATRVLGPARTVHPSTSHVVPLSNVGRLLAAANGGGTATENPGRRTT